LGLKSSKFSQQNGFNF